MLWTWGSLSYDRQSDNYLKYAIFKIKFVTTNGPGNKYNIWISGVALNEIWNAIEFNFITSLRALLTRTNFNQPAVLIQQNCLLVDGENYRSLPHYIHPRSSIPGAPVVLNGFVSETMCSLILFSPDDSIEIHFTVFLTMTAFSEIQVSKLFASARSPRLCSRIAERSRESHPDDSSWARMLGPFPMGTVHQKISNFP